MAITVNFYTFEKKENSTKQPGGGGQGFSCTLNAGCSVVAPVIRLNTDDPTGYNYAYIPSWNRYYFIRDWEWAGSGLWHGHLSVDVLASYKDEIGSSSNYVLRAAARSNGDIADSLYPTTAAITQQVTTGGVPFQQNLTLGYYVVGVIGNSATAQGAVTYYAMDPSTYARFGALLFSDDEYLKLTKTDTIAGIDPETGRPVRTEVEVNNTVLKAEFNPAQYVTSVMWFPISMLPIAGSSPIKLGWWELGTGAGLLGSTVYTASGTLSVPTHPQQAARGYYLNTSPYSRFTLSFPGFGMIPLDGSYFVKSPSISWTVRVNLVNGMGTLLISSPATGGAPFVMATGKIGTEISVGQLTSQGTAAGMSFLGAAAGLLASAATGNVLGAIQSVHTGISSIAQSTLPQVSVTGGSGGCNGMFGDPIRLISQFSPVAPNDLEHKGAPLCEKVQLSSLAGYQLISSPVVEIPGTAEEQARIKSYLEGGYYFE